MRKQRKDLSLKSTTTITQASYLRRKGTKKNSQTKRVKKRKKKTMKKIRRMKKKTQMRRKKKMTRKRMKIAQTEKQDNERVVQSLRTLRSQAMIELKRTYLIHVS